MYTVVKYGTETVSHIQVIHLDLYIHLGMLEVRSSGIVSTLISAI
jgi:hypothetical protein